MSIVSEPQKAPLTRRERIMDLAAFLERQPCKVQLSFRPFCPVHTSALMNYGTHKNGQNYYYCQQDDCDESIKIVPKKVV